MAQEVFREEGQHGGVETVGGGSRGRKDAFSCGLKSIEKKYRMWNCQMKCRWRIIIVQKLSVGVNLDVGYNNLTKEMDTQKY